MSDAASLPDSDLGPWGYCGDFQYPGFEPTPDWQPLVEWVRAMRRVQFRIPQPRSSLAADDSRSFPQAPVSVAMTLGFQGAMNQLDALSHLVETGSLHVMGPAGALIRAAMESAAPAVWIGEAPTRTERIDRAFEWWCRNAQDAADTTDEFGGRARQLQSFDQMKDEWRKERGNNPKLTEQWKILRWVRDNTDIGDVLSAWKYCSGLSHNRPWALTSGGPPTDPDVVVPELRDQVGTMVDISGDPSVLLPLATMATNMAKKVLHRYEMQSAPWL